MRPATLAGEGKKKGSTSSRPESRNQSKRSTRGPIGFLCSAMKSQNFLSSLSAAFSSLFATLPVRERGSDSRNSTTLGILKLASLSRQNFSSSRLPRLSPTLGTTTAFKACPLSGSGIPTTATSATLGWEMMTFSTSEGYTFMPPVMIMSSARPNT